MCTLYTYTNIHMPRFSPSGFVGLSRCLIPTPGLTTEYPICAVCVCVYVYTHIHPHTLPPASKIEKIQTTTLSLSLGKNVYLFYYSYVSILPKHTHIPSSYNMLNAVCTSRSHMCVIQPRLYPYLLHPPDTCKCVHVCTKTVQ